jgi:hypothetical protein
MSSAFIERDAARVLFILYFCSDECLQRSLFDEFDYTHLIDSESKLQKIDFWIRYPDHLAAALLRGCESGGNLINQVDEVKQIIRRIFQEQEPILRWIPMRKYLHGAYEPLDKVMAFLSSRVLAYRRAVEWGHRTCYFLTPKGSGAVEGLLKECEESRWYAERCQLIKSFFGHLHGYDIRKLQYLEEDYSAAPYTETIDRIEAEVRRRYSRLFGELL